MALETGTYVGDLNPLNPAAADPKAQGDDHIRLLKDALRKSFPGFTGPVLLGGSDSGSATAYALTPATPLPAYVAGMLVMFKATNSNTGTAPTLNVSGLGAKTIIANDGSALNVGDIIAGKYVALVYDGTAFQMTGVTKRYVDMVREYASQLAFASSLPSQTGNAGKFIQTDGTNATWQWPQNMPRSARTANAILAQADRASYVDITSGTFTQTFTAAATLGAGWYVFLKNSGTGDITIPSSDGFTNWIMYPGEARLFQCDGTAFRSMVIQSFTRTFTVSDNFIRPPGYQQFGGILWGAGGSGAKYTATSTSLGGGGGGAGAPFTLPVSLFAASTPVAIGAGGAAVSADNTNGNPGGNSTLGSLITAYGGLGGRVGNNTVTAIAMGGSAYLQTTNVATNSSIASTDGYLSGGVGNPGAGTNSSSVYGGGGGNGIDSVNNIGVAGQSVFAGGGGAFSFSGPAGDGVAPSGGGGATRTGTSGAGARGELRIWGIA